MIIKRLVREFNGRSIEVTLDDSDYIHIFDASNSYEACFNIDEIDDFYSVLDWVEDYEEYDDEEDEYYHPDEVDTGYDGDTMCPSYSGNFLATYRVDYIRDTVKEFTNGYSKVDTSTLKDKTRDELIGILEKCSPAHLEKILCEVDNGSSC